jgi:hypothetical protein
MVRPRRPTLRKQWMRRLPPSAHPHPHAGGRDDRQVCWRRNWPPAGEREVESASGPAGWPTLRQALALPNAPDITTTKGLRASAIIAPCRPAAPCALPRWRRSPMGAVRADSRWRRRATHCARIRRACRCSPAISGRASSRALRVLGAAGVAGGAGRARAPRSGETRLKADR